MPKFEPMYRAYCWDLETTHLRADMGKVIVASFMDMTTGRMMTKTIVDFPGKSPKVRERRFMKWIYERFCEADTLIGQNTKAFDVNFLRGRAEVLGLSFQFPKRHHIDTYLVARYGWKGKQSYSMESMADMLGLDEQKDKPSKLDWADSIALDEPAIRRLIQRCESDVRVTAKLYRRFRRYYMEWRGQ